MADGEVASVFSIWLIPSTDSSVYSRVAEEIQTLTDRYEGVPFETHVTLVGGVQTTKSDMLKKTEELAAQLKVRQWPCHAMRCMRRHFTGRAPGSWCRCNIRLCRVSREAKARRAFAPKLRPWRMLDARRNGCRTAISTVALLIAAASVSPTATSSCAILPAQS